MKINDKHLLQMLQKQITSKYSTTHINVYVLYKIRYYIVLFYIFISANKRFNLKQTISYSFFF